MSKIVIEYEHKAREMETVLLLSYILKKRGHKVKLIQINEQNRIQYLFWHPDMIITPYLYGNFELFEYVYKIFGKVKKICNLQWEQVYNGTSKENKRTPKELARKAVHICWGEDSYDRLKMSGCKNAVLTGAPQLDFLRKEFRGWYKERKDLFEEYGIDESKKTILFISTFTYFGLSDERMEELKKIVDFDPYSFRELTERTRDEVLNWFERILKDNSDVNIIYRPHPGELMDERINSFSKNNENFHIISDYSVKQWITTCDIILNWYSTAGVEVYFAGKANLFLRPFAFPHDMDFEMFTDACYISSYDELKKYIASPELINEYYLSHPIEIKLSPYYLIDNECAYMKIISVIEKMINHNLDDFSCKKFIFPVYIYNDVYSFFRYIIYKLFSGDAKWIARLVNKSKMINNMVKYHRRLEIEKIGQKEENDAYKKFLKLGL